MVNAKKKNIFVPLGSGKKVFRRWIFLAPPPKYLMVPPKQVLQYLLNVVVTKCIEFLQIQRFCNILNLN